MKKVMVIAGGNWQVALCRKLKEMDHWVVCSNLYPDSPAFRYADACEVADVRDKEANLGFAVKHGIDAVLTDQSDLAVPTVAYVAERLGLPGIGVRAADICTDKALMRDFCKEHGFLIPDYKSCHGPEDAAGMLEKHGKIIIKPVDSQSARGTFIVDSMEKLEECYPVALSYANRRKEVMAEEYVGGTEFTIDGLVVNGHHHPLCISCKEMHEKNPTVSMKQTYTYGSTKFDYDRLRAENRALAEAVGLPFGLTHTEYRYDKGRFYLLEIAARGGGSNLSSAIVPYMSGIDNYGYLIRSALGETCDERGLMEHTVPEKNCVIMQFFDFGTGTVKKVCGLDRLEASRYMLDWNLPVRPGDRLEEPRFGSMRPGHFSIAGTDLGELEEERAALLRQVYVEFE